MTGFYRETAKKRKRYINVSEAVINLYRTSYRVGVEQDRVAIYKGRKLVSPRLSDTLAVKLLGGPTSSIYLDVVKNPDMLLSLDNLPYYSFHIEDITAINGRTQYVVSFKPQRVLPYALYYGKLYIDREKLSFTRAEFYLDVSERHKAIEAILRRKPSVLRFKPLEVGYLVN